MFPHPHGMFLTLQRELGECACNNVCKRASHVCNISHCMSSKLGEYSEGLVNKIRK